jgi:hypothetical protein
VGAQLIVFFVHRGCHCVMQPERSQTSRWICFEPYLDCMAICLKRKFQNKHLTLLYFSAKPHSTMMENLLLLLGDLSEIAFRHALPFRKRD